MSRTVRTVAAIGAGLAALCGGTATAHADAPSYVRLQAEHSYKCLTIDGGRIGDNAYAVQSSCDRNLDNQLFELRPAGSGALQVRAKHSGKCLTIGGEYKGNAAQQWCFDNDNQRWKVMLVEVEEGLYELRPVSDTAFCLTIPNHSYDDGAKSMLLSCIGATDQRWRLLPAS